MTRTLIALALLAPGLALADRCEHSAPRQLDLNLDGVRELRFDIASHDVSIVAGPGPARVDGRACSSDADVLDRITLSQERRGEVLWVRAESNASFVGLFLRPTYARLELQATLPATLPLRIELGSGDARVSGMQDLGAEVGSGDLEILDAATVTVEVGSGDVDIERVSGPVRIGIGSGDASLDEIGGLEVDRIGSGDLEARGIAGDVRIDGIGSGEASLREVRGAVVVHSLGSGEVQAYDVEGSLTVDRVGSGDVRHARVAGKVHLPAD